MHCEADLAAKSPFLTFLKILKLIKRAVFGHFCENLFFEIMIKKL